jgi:uncharacterized membrane protein YqjE
MSADPEVNDPAARPARDGSVRHQPSAASLVTEALSHVSALVRKEVDLARAEMSENAKKAAVAVGLLVGAIVVALVALNVLAAALTVAVAELLGDAAEWAPLIVGGLLAAIAFAMVAKGVNDLKASSLAPSRTVKNLKRDGEAVKESI